MKKCCPKPKIKILAQATDIQKLLTAELSVHCPEAKTSSQS